MGRGSTGVSRASRFKVREPATRELRAEKPTRTS